MPHVTVLAVRICTRSGWLATADGEYVSGPGASPPGTGPWAGSYCATSLPVAVDLVFLLSNCCGATYTAHTELAAPLTTGDNIDKVTTAQLMFAMLADRAVRINPIPFPSIL